MTGSRGLTNVYHITYEPSYHVLGLHFWGCNLDCRGCYKNYDIYDLSLGEKSLDQLAQSQKAEPPTSFLTVDEVMAKIAGLEVKRAIFMGKEAALDPLMPALAAAVHGDTSSFNILLSNGLKLADLDHIDEVTFSFKAFSDEVHRQYTGISNRQILENFKAIYKSGKQLQAEIAFIPDLVENEQIEALARFIASIDKNLLFRITSYFAVPGAPWLSASRRDVERAASLAEKYLNNVTFVTADMKSDKWNPRRIF